MTASSRACVRNAAHHAEHHYVAQGRGWSSGYPPALSPETYHRARTASDVLTWAAIGLVVVVVVFNLWRGISG